MAFGVQKWPFLAKNIKFWPKMAIFSGPKIFKFFFLHFRQLVIVFNEKQKWTLFWPLLAPFLPLLLPFRPMFGKPDHIHWTMVMWYLVWKHSMRRNGRTTFENFWNTKNIHFGKKTRCLWPKIRIFAHPDQIHWGMGAYDSSKWRSRWVQKIMLAKKFFGTPKKWPLGSENGDF